MLELKPLDPKTSLFPRPQPGSPARKQQRLMVVALSLLLATLAFVLYHDRDFWFPDADTPQAEDQVPQATPAAKTASPATSSPAPRAAISRNPSRKHKTSVAVSATQPAPPIEPVTVSRTVLPPLEIEVVAGANHRVLHPGTNSVRVEMQDSPQQTYDSLATQDTATAASVTSNAADRLRVPAATTDVVMHAVQPDYPMLARQMKVEGSVILQALIARDGMIQDLRVLSGPPILATAAQEAVRQWHFKPHFDGGTTVETQAKITVNFTIQTN